MSFSFNFSILPLRKNFKVFFCFFIFAIPFLTLSFSEEKVQYLKKVGEIKDGFSSERENFFIKITGLCCDDEGNLYVADSGWNKIFKFDSNGKFLMSFGREGQGPGEFMGQRMSNHLKISFGNDGKLYVNDPGNSRISVFTKEGKFLKSHRTPPFTYDTPVVNSRGDIYLLSKSGIKAIDYYDSNFKYKGSLLDMEEHLQFPFGKPYKEIFHEYRIPAPDEIFKLMTKEDELIVMSSFAWKIYIFNRNNQEVRDFKIKEKSLIEDYKRNLELLKERNKEIEKTLPKEVETAKLVIPPFEPFICNKDLCLFYVKSDGSGEIYRYKTNGLYLDRRRISGDATLGWGLFYWNFEGLRCFKVRDRSTKIEVFLILWNK